MDGPQIRLDRRGRSKTAPANDLVRPALHGQSAAWWLICLQAATSEAIIEAAPKLVDGVRT